jgi:hypothetical protein
MSSSRSALSRGLRGQQDGEPPASPGVPQRMSQSLPASAALPIAIRGATMDIPASNSLSRGGSGVFDASPAWDGPSSSYSESMYGASPLIGTPFPYLVRQAPRQPMRPLRQVPRGTAVCSRAGSLLASARLACSTQQTSYLWALVGVGCCVLTDMLQLIKVKP